jgi:hypothetical protein
MKISQIKKLVKEVIETAITEAASDASWVLNDDTVTIEGLELADGRSIDADVWFSGEWDDGAFDYEYGSIKGTHRYPVQYSIEEHNIYEIRNAGTNDVIWQYKAGGPLLQATLPELAKEIEKYWSDIEREVEQQVEPPEPDFDDRSDDER